jgi:hypothetical protein
VLDKSYSDSCISQPEWADGTPERSFWSGVKVKGHTRHPVVTFRCAVRLPGVLRPQRQLTPAATSASAADRGSTAAPASGCSLGSHDWSPTRHLGCQSVTLPLGARPKLFPFAPPLLQQAAVA